MTEIEVLAANVQTEAFTLKMTPQLRETLDNLAKEMDRTLSGVLRRAIALLEVAVKASKNGATIGIKNQDGSFTEIRVL